MLSFALLVARVFFLELICWFGGGLSFDAKFGTLLLAAKAHLS